MKIPKSNFQVYSFGNQVDVNRSRTTSRNSAMLSKGVEQQLIANSRHALCLKHFLQLTILGHFADDVAAANEFPFDVELRDGWPVGEFLDAFAQLIVLKHIVGLEFGAGVVENLDGLGGKTAHREDGRSLHVKYDVVAFRFGF